jgi:hypothetical protein
LAEKSAAITLCASSVLINVAKSTDTSCEKGGKIAEEESPAKLLLHSASKGFALLLLLLLPPPPPDDFSDSGALMRSPST